MFHEGRSSETFGKIHRKTPVPEFSRNEVSATLFILKKGLRHNCLPGNFTLQTLFLYNTSG